jgi:hypothetical protein
MPIAKLKYLVVNGDLATGNFAPCINTSVLTVSWQPDAAYTHQRLSEIKLTVSWQPDAAYTHQRLSVSSPYRD